VRDFSRSFRMRIFSYGTLREPHIFHRVAGTLAPLVEALPAELPGWRVVPLRGTPYTTLERHHGARTEGLLIEVGPQVLRRLHIYEHTAYRFRLVHVTVGSLRIPAHAWIARYPAPEKSSS
jgi:hypothetical protein